MATENELQKAHQEGYNAGQLEARVAGLEDGLQLTRWKTTGQLWPQY